jgi:hypothetical protein
MEKYASNKPQILFAVLALISILALAQNTFSSAASANANTKLTDGINASSSKIDPAWVYFDKDAKELPQPYGKSYNLNMEFFGTNEYGGNNSISEKRIEELLYEAGSKAYRATLYLDLFSEPMEKQPYWDFDSFEKSSHGQRIRRALNAGQMVNIVVHRTPPWANKSLSTTHPPIEMMVMEEITLNGTTPAQLTHKFVMGENNEQYDRVSVVDAKMQTYEIMDEMVGISSGASWQEYNLRNSNIYPGKISLFIDGKEWKEAKHFDPKSINKNEFIFFPNTGKIKFADGWQGNIPKKGALITANYSYYPETYKEFNNSAKSNIDYKINYSGGTIRRTGNSSIPSGSKVLVTYYYLDTTWWKEFWKELTTHYKGQVKYFEVWNEEDNPKFWQGSNDQYLQMLRTAYEGAKEGNSDSEIIFGGLSFFSNNNNNFYYTTEKKLFDIFAWHPYGWEIAPDNPNSHFNILNNTFFSQAGFTGEKKPIFLNELGFSTNQDGGMSWDEQATAMSRMYMMLRRNHLIANASWWGVLDLYPIGIKENELYSSHLGLIAYDTQSKLILKPSYYSFKNLAKNKGIIIDLAEYSNSGALKKEDYLIDKIILSSNDDKIVSARISTSWKNINDWNYIPSTMTKSKNSMGYDYTITFPPITTRYVGIEITKKSGENYALDEIQVLENGKNIALNKYYAAEGFIDSNINETRYQIQTPTSPPVDQNLNKPQKQEENIFQTIYDFFASLFGFKK